MLIITAPAAEAMRNLGAPDDGGVRISLTHAWSDGRGPGLTLEPAAAPELEDEVIETDGFQLYIAEDALHMLQDKVLDAEEDGDEVRFSVHD